MKSTYAPAVACGVIALVWAAGCAQAPRTWEPEETAVLPLYTGGMVAAHARGRIEARWERAAARLCAWEALCRAQKSTIDAVVIDVSAQLDAQVAALARTAGLAGEGGEAAARAWWGASRDAFPQALVMLRALHAADTGGPAGALALVDAPSAIAGGLVFGAGGASVLALADVRTRVEPAGAALLEVHYYVSQSYTAGVNVYRIAPGEDGALILDVQILCWVPQVEGIFGAISRRVAERELRRQATTTWAEIAAYLSA